MTYNLRFQAIETVIREGLARIAPVLSALELKKLCSWGVRQLRRKAGNVPERAQGATVLLMMDNEDWDANSFQWHRGHWPTLWIPEDGR